MPALFMPEMIWQVPVVLHGFLFRIITKEMPRLKELGGASMQIKVCREQVATQDRDTVATQDRDTVDIQALAVIQASVDIVDIVESVDTLASADIQDRDIAVTRVLE